MLFINGDISIEIVKGDSFKSIFIVTKFTYHAVRPIPSMVKPLVLRDIYNRYILFFMYCE